MNGWRHVIQSNIQMNGKSHQHVIIALFTRFSLCLILLSFRLNSSADVWLTPYSPRIFIITIIYRHFSRSNQLWNRLLTLLSFAEENLQSKTHFNIKIQSILYLGAKSQYLVLNVFGFDYPLPSFWISNTHCWLPLNQWNLIQPFLHNRLPLESFSRHFYFFNPLPSL